VDFVEADEKVRLAVRTGDILGWQTMGGGRPA